MSASISEAALPLIHVHAKMATEGTTVRCHYVAMSRLLARWLVAKMEACARGKTIANASRQNPYCGMFMTVLRGDSPDTRARIVPFPCAFKGSLIRIVFTAKLEEEEKDATDAQTVEHVLVQTW